MSDIKRVKLKEDDIDQVVGGLLHFQGGTLYSDEETNPTTYYYKSFSDCQSYMRTSCRDMTDAETISALLGAGKISLTPFE